MLKFIKKIRVLILISLLGVFPQFAMAIAVQPSGTGTSSDPYLIANLDNLEWVSETSSSWDKHFKQTADIDASTTSSWNSGKGWSPIGNATVNFTGNYDGNLKIITGITSIRPTETNIGFFGKINAATIQQVLLKNLNISGYNYVGGLVAYMEDSYSNVITKCAVSGVVNSSHVGIYGGGGTGGLIGDSRNGRGIVTLSFSEVNANAQGGYVGGFLGYGDQALNIEDSFSVGNAGMTSASRNGGFAGKPHADGVFKRVYAAGEVGNGYGFGYDTRGTVENSFWDINATNSASGDHYWPNKILGKTTTQMQTQSTFTDVGWDFVGETTNGTDNYWSINSGKNDGRPYLTWTDNTNWYNATPTLPNISNITTSSTTNQVINITSTDTDGEAITLSIESSDTAVATVALSNETQTGNDKNATLTITRVSEGTATITLKATDANGAESTKTFTYINDQTSPTITITGTDGGNSFGSGSHSMSENLTVTFTTNESTTNFTSSDVVITNGTLSSFTAVSSTEYTAVITPSSDGTVTVDVSNATFTDASGNDSTSTQFTYVDERVSILRDTMNSLQVGLGTNKSLGEVVTNLTLPTSLNGFTISWASTNTTALAVDGTVSRQGTESKIELKATISKSGLTTYKKFEVIVVPTLTDTTTVQRAVININSDNLLGDNISTGSVMQNLTLPTNLSDIVGGATGSVSWSSSDTNVIDNSGTITRDSTDKIVTLTATFTQNGQMDTRDFVFVVKADIYSDSDAIGNSLSMVTLENLLASNRSNNTISSNLDLNVSKFTLESGVSLSFTSDNTNVISNNGTVIRQSTDTTVKVKATLSKNLISSSKVFEFKVKPISSAVKIVTMGTVSDSVVGNKKTFTFSYDESLDSNLSSVTNISPVFVSESNTTIMTTNASGNKVSTMDNSSSNTKVKEIKTTFTQSGVVENEIQVRSTANSTDTNIKVNKIRNEIVDATTTRNNDGSLEIESTIGTNSAIVKSDIDGIMTQTLQDSNNTVLSQLTSRFIGSSATISEDNTLNVTTPIFKIDPTTEVLSDTGTLEANIELQSDSNGSIDIVYSIESIDDNTITKKVNINITSQVKGEVETKEESSVVSSDDAIMEVKTLELNGKKVVIYTTPSGYTRTATMNSDGTNRVFTIPETTYFQPTDAANVDINIDSDNGELRTTIITPLIENINF